MDALNFIVLAAKAATAAATAAAVASPPTNRYDASDLKVSM